MYAADDPRAGLTKDAAPDERAGLPIAAAQYADLHELAPDDTTSAGSPTWYVAGQNFTLAHTDLAAGDRLSYDSPHEYVVVQSDPEAAIHVTAGSERQEVRGIALVVLAPGSSSVEAASNATIARLFDVRDADMSRRASNRAAYAQPDRRVTPLAPWPAPSTPRAIRIYRVDDFPPTPGRFGTIFRTSSFMVNFIGEQLGQRDPDTYSPHHHDDFEQCSYAVEGTWTHHIRTPWGPRSTEWRDDEHVSIGSPSVTIIPPPTVHTSASAGAGRNRLIDIFCPPRVDFSERDGWVLNAADYPAAQPR